MSGAIDTALHPLEWGVAWLVVTLHSAGVALGLPAGAGVTWSLSLIGLVVVVHVLLFPFLLWRLRQKHALRRAAPRIAEVRARYAGRTSPEDRRELIRELTAAHGEHGTNPLYFVLPVVLQVLVLIALIRAVRQGLATGIGPLTEDLAEEAGSATVLGLRLVDAVVASGPLAGRALLASVVLGTAVVGLLSRRRATRRDSPPDKPPEAHAFGRFLSWLIFAVCLLLWPQLPAGVVVVLVANSLWAVGERSGIIRWSPTPDSLADQALTARRARRASTPPAGPPPPPAAGPTDDSRGGARDDS